MAYFFAHRSRVAFGGVALVLVGVWACGGEAASPAGGALDAGADAVVAADGASDAAAHDSGDAADGSSDSGGPLACGAATCGATEYCVHPCSGGALPLCNGGDPAACPTGTVSGSCLGDGGPTTGCVPAPPPPYCSATPTCPANTQASPGGGRDVRCTCA